MRESILRVTFSKEQDYFAFNQPFPARNTQSKNKTKMNGTTKTPFTKFSFQVIFTQDKANKMVK